MFHKVQMIYLYRNRNREKIESLSNLKLLYINPSYLVPMKDKLLQAHSIEKGEHG